MCIRAVSSSSVTADVVVARTIGAHVAVCRNSPYKQPKPAVQWLLSRNERNQREEKRPRATPRMTGLASLVGETQKIGFACQPVLSPLVNAGWSAICAVSVEPISKASMRRNAVCRLLALSVLLLHGSAFAAASVLDGTIAARAYATPAHVETQAGNDCATHDEANCLLCRVGADAAWLTPGADAGVLVAATSQRVPDGATAPASPSTGALRSRAPPAA